MGKPLLIILICFLPGLVLGHQLPAPPWLLLTSAGALALLSLIKPEECRVALPLAIFVTAWCLQVTTEHPVHSNDLRNIFGQRHADIELEGTIAEAPRPTLINTPGSEASNRWRLILDRLTITSPDTPFTSPSLVQVEINALTNVVFSVGNRIQLTGVIGPPETGIHPKSFRPDIALARKGIHHVLQADAHSLRFIDNRTSWVIQLQQSFQQRASATLSKGLPPDASTGLIRAMALGWRNELSPEVRTALTRSGTIHLFAISGLHIGLIAFVLVQCLSFIGAPRWMCALISIPLIWFYTAATGWQPSAIRASIMATIITASWGVHRPTNLLNSLAGAALLILLWNPLQLFQPGFQLSFGVVTSIAVSLPWIQERLIRINFKSLLIPHSKKSRFTIIREQFMTWIGRLLVGSFLISVACWLGAAPFTAMHFHLVPMISPLINVPAVWAGSLSLMSGFGSLVTAAILPWDWPTEIFNASAWFFMNGLIGISQWLTNKPWIVLPISELSLLSALCLWGAILIMLGNLAILIRSRKIASAILLLITPALFEAVEGNRTPEIVLHANAAGTTLIKDSHGGISLIDPGRNQEIGRLLGELNSRSIRSLDRLILSHGDIEHVQGAAKLLTSVPANEVWVSDASFRSTPYKRAIKELDHLPVKSGFTQSGIHVLHPLNPTPHTADEACMALQLELRGTSILMISDLNREGQNQLITNHPNLKTDILICSIDGESKPPSLGFISSLSPQLILLHDTGTKTPKDLAVRFRNRMKFHGIPFRSTSVNGTLSTQFVNGEWKTTGMKLAP